MPGEQRAVERVAMPPSAAGPRARAVHSGMAGRLAALLAPFIERQLLQIAAQRRMQARMCAHGLHALPLCRPMLLVTPHALSISTNPCRLRFLRAEFGTCTGAGSLKM